MSLPNEPTTLPKFADIDLIDPISLQNNVAAPGTNLEDYGWYPFRVRPKRNYMNWLHRWTYRWCKHLKEDVVPQIETNISDISDNATAIGNNATDITNLQTDISDVNDRIDDVQSYVEILLNKYSEEEFTLNYGSPNESIVETNRFIECIYIRHEQFVMISIGSANPNTNWGTCPNHGDPDLEKILKLYGFPPNIQIWEGGTKTARCELIGDNGSGNPILLPGIVHIRGQGGSLPYLGTPPNTPTYFEFNAIAPPATELHMYQDTWNTNNHPVWAPGDLKGVPSGQTILYSLYDDHSSDGGGGWKWYPLPNQSPKYPSPF